MSHRDLLTLLALLIAFAIPSVAASVETEPTAPGATRYSLGGVERVRVPRSAESTLPPWIKTTAEFWVDESGVVALGSAVDGRTARVGEAATLSGSWLPTGRGGRKLTLALDPAGEEALLERIGGGIFVLDVSFASTPKVALRFRRDGSPLLKIRARVVVPGVKGRIRYSARLTASELGLPDAPAPHTAELAEIDTLRDELDELAQVAMSPDESVWDRVPEMKAIEASIGELSQAIEPMAPLACTSCTGTCTTLTVLAETESAVEGVPGTVPSECIDDICGQCAAQYQNVECHAVCAS